ncbi:MAG: hypothetical protein M3Y57_03165 [Acidobacteriota bacterium]|nr:hypothetical protein [Acidobacteriota bacterium]
MTAFLSQSLSRKGCCEWSVMSRLRVRFAATARSASGGLPLLPVLVVLLLARPGWAQRSASSPDFSAVADILNGQYTLLTVDDVVFGSRLLNTNDSKVTNQQSAPDTAFATQGNSTRRGEVLAHMFAGSGDVLVYTTTDKVVVYDPRTRKSLSFALTDKDGFATSLSAGDLTGDQYDDVVVGSASGVRVLTAADPNDFGKGIRLGPLARANRADQANAIGKFSGDANQIAQLVTATDADIYIFSVNPKTLEAMRAGQWQSKASPSRDPAQAESLAVGHFYSTTQDQLLFGKIGIPGKSTLRTVSLELLDFDKSVKPQVRDRAEFTIEEAERTLLQPGHLDPNSKFDQVVQINDYNRTYHRPFSGGARAHDPLSYFRIISFNNRAQITPGPYQRHTFRVLDFAIGNFDRLASGRPTLGQQIAVIAGFSFESTVSVGTGKANLQIYNVTIKSTGAGDVLSIAENPTSEYSLGDYYKSKKAYSNGDQQFQNIPLIAGDLQARSIGLGNPVKITITDQIRPDVVLSLPPMHVDYVKPYRTGTFPGCDNTAKPCDVNISVLPGSFQTSFSSSNEKSTESVRKSTTSYGYASEIGGGASLVLGDTDANSFSASYAYAVKNSYENEVATSDSKYSAEKDSLSSTTGFADHLFFTRERLNVWVYPIMGLKVCPRSKPSCADAEKTQAYVEYSGPDNITLFDVDATTQEWYQPIDEPGNVFSYPWSVALFESTYPSAGLLTARPAWRGIDTTQSSYESNWTKESTKDVSVGAKTLTTHDNTFTSSATVGAAGIAQLQIDFSSNFNRSTGLETLEDSTVSLESNNGLKVDKPAFSSNIANNYGYYFAGFVYANHPPAQPPARPVVIAPDGSPADLQTHGPLLSGFLANLNPLRDQRVASFWTQAYNQPDIALNHPARWSWNKNSGDVTFNGKNLEEDPIRQEFYWMKGLYITPVGAGGMGPQRQETSVDQPLDLRARVYNYSLVDVPSQAQVRVEFYGQLVDTKTDHLSGGAFRIGGATLPPIPGFNSKPATPNWALAGTVFDPRQFAQTRDGKVYLAFWVVAWYEDPAGKLGPEVADHGLTAIPGSWSQISQVGTEAHSNNVGLYGAHIPLYIAPSENPSTSTAAAFVRATNVAPETSASVVMESLSGAPQHLAANAKATVSATLHNLSDQMSSQVIAFYDGDPAAGTKPFEMQEIPIIPAGDLYTVSASFRPETPGVHTLYAVADPGTSNATMQIETITVDQ